jgi:hypothetical protein
MFRTRQEITVESNSTGVLVLRVSGFYNGQKFKKKSDSASILSVPFRLTYKQDIYN